MVNSEFLKNMVAPPFETNHPIKKTFIWHGYTLERTHDKIYPIFCLLKKSSEYLIDSMNFKKNYISKSCGNRMDHIFDKNIFSVHDTVGKMKDNILIKIRQKLHQINQKNTEI